jgi:hypothetical protein
MDTGNNNPNEALLISVQHSNQYVITEYISGQSS